MIRSTRVQKAERLRAARRLLADEIGMAEAAVALSRTFGLSRRQAYRYLELARAGAPPLAAEDSVTIAIKTAALVAFARAQQFEVPKEWIFEDDGYSGANLIRPGLERVRDLAAEGLIQAVLIYAPDRLSRRYAHQILLIEELARAGVETLFVRAPRGSTPEDELLVQFQGMIAEYERAQILERSQDKDAPFTRAVAKAGRIIARPILGGLQSVDRTAYLRLAETLATFLTRLRSSAGALEVLERQRVLRLLVKEILVGDDKIIIRHCIPLPMAPGDGPPAGSADAALPATQSYLLRSRSHLAAAGEPVPALRVRQMDGAGVPPHPLRALCGRRDLSLQNRGGRTGPLACDCRPLCGLQAGSSSREDEDRLLQGCEPARRPPGHPLRFSGLPVPSPKDDVGQAG